MQLAHTPHDNRTVRSRSEEGDGAALATVVRGRRKRLPPPCLSKHVREDIQTVPRAMVSGHRREARRFTSPSPGATGRGGDITATGCS